MQDSLVSASLNAHSTPPPALHIFLLLPTSTQRITNGMTMTGKIAGRRQDNPKVQVQKRSRRMIQSFVAQWFPVDWRHKEAFIGRRRNGTHLAATVFSSSPAHTLPPLANEAGCP